MSAYSDPALELTVNGHRIWCHTGGQASQAGQPTAVFLHGVLNAHSVWVTQARWSHARQLPPTAPFTASELQEASQALMQAVLASHPGTNLMHTGFKACDDYRNGEAAMARVECPTLFLLGAQDVMTPPQAAARLQAGARDGRTVTLDCGHALMSEDPEGVLQALRQFLGA